MNLMHPRIFTLLFALAVIAFAVHSVYRTRVMADMHVDLLRQQERLLLIIETQRDEAIAGWEKCLDGKRQ